MLERSGMEGSLWGIILLSHLDAGQLEVSPPSLSSVLVVDTGNVCLAKP